MNVRYECLKMEERTEIDPWKLLGISPGATPDEIKRAFRHKIKEYHPDSTSVLPGREQCIQPLVYAYRFLEKQCRPQIQAADSIFCEKDEEPRVNNSNDGIFIFLEISLKDAFEGRTVETVISDVENFCPVCSGRGNVPRRGAPECIECCGSGFLELPWGSSVMRVVCNACGGSGTVSRVTCSMCKGRGRISRQRTVRIRLPRGIREGTILKLPGQGPWRQEKQCRDTLFVEIKVNLPAEWQIEGLDIHSRTCVDIWTALAGGVVVVETVDGAIPCRCSPGSLEGTELVLKGRGWVDEIGMRGDHRTVLDIKIPGGNPPPLARAVMKWLSCLWPVEPPNMTRALPHHEKRKLYRGQTEDVPDS